MTAADPWSDDGGDGGDAAPTARGRYDNIAAVAIVATAAVILLTFVALGVAIVVFVRTSP